MSGVYNFLSYVFSSFANCHLSLALACMLSIVVWKFAKHIFEVATTSSGIHYVDNKPREIKMNTTVQNPFFFKADVTKASFSGVKCYLKCDGTCYVQALWGVPICTLIELLHKDWLDIIHSVTTHEPEGLSFKCKHAEEPFILANNVEKVTEFQLPSNFNEAILSDKAVHSRTIYPFVLLMVLIEHGDESKYPEPYVIANANVLHLPDDVLNKAEIIAQFIRLSSGHLGQVIKIYRSSPDEERMFDLCLICYQEPASVVQLSCRHSCLCRRCYEKCDKCPLCRNTYMDFFEIPVNVDTELLH